MLRDDRQLIERDSAIPGLASLLSIGSRSELFARLGWQDASRVSVDYLRYKPRSSCLAGLTATIDGRERRATVIAYADSLASKLAKIEQTADPSLVSIDPGMLLAICRFPFDRRLPSLERLVSRQPRLIDRLLPSDMPADEVQLSALRYKPERRFVARMDHRGVAIGTIKAYSPAAYHHARRVAKTLGDASQVGESRSLGHSDRHSMISFAWRAGTEATAAAWPNIARQAAHEVASLHTRRTSKLPAIGKAQFLNRVSDAGDFAVWLAPEHASLIRSVQSAIVARLSPLDLSEVVLHGDLHLGQMLLDETQLAIIDFDRACLGPAEWDLANLAVDLHQRTGAPSHDGDIRSPLAEFLDEYESQANPINLSALATLAALRLFETSLEPFRSRQPDWQSSLANYIRAADAALTVAPLPAQVNTSGNLPIDSSLPWLATVCDAREAGAHFAKLPDGYVVHESHVVRHKPGRRALVKYHVTTSNSGQEHVLLGKTEHKPRHHRRFNVQQQLWQSGFDAAAADGISVARPVGIVAEWNMWLQEHVPGTGGWKALGGSEAIANAALAARALAKLHRAEVRVARIHDFADERQLLVDRLTDSIELAPALQSRIERLREECRALCEFDSQQPHVVLHRDFYPDQLQFTQQGVVILDLDLICHGPAAIDVGNFAGHLVEMGIRRHGDPDHFAKVEAAFVATYLTETDYDIRAQIERARLLTLARHVYISLARPDRQDSTPQLVDWCEEAFCKFMARN